MRMRKLTQICFRASIAGLCLLLGSTYGYSLQKDPESPVVAPSASHKGLKLTERQIETIKAVQPYLFREKGEKKVVSTAQTLKLLNQPKVQAFKAPQRLNASRSSIQGWRTAYYSFEETDGWYELNEDGSQNLLWEYHDPTWVDDGWSEEPDFPFSCGFVRDGKIYGFHSEVFWTFLIWGHGCFTFDGEIEEYQEYGDDLDLYDLSTYVITCAYDEANDVIYAYTLNSDGSAYMFQKINPDTWEFAYVADVMPIEDVCIAMAYNPVDGKTYGVTPDSRFVTIDAATGTLTPITTFDFAVTTLSCGMTYSPYDGLFYLVYSDGGYNSVLYSIDPSSSQLEELGTLPNTIQYRILVTPDRLVADNTPLVPEIQSIDFPNGFLTGTAKVRMPAFTFDGSPISAPMTLWAYVDGQEMASVSGGADEIVDVEYPALAEGMHTFSFKAEADNVMGLESKQKLFVGFGIPAVPSNISITETLISWDPVTETIDGGYLDLDNLCYNVYFDGALLTETPVSECQYAYDAPDGDYASHVAQVEAVNNNHKSARGYSNNILFGNPIPVPVHITPTEAEAALVTVSSEYTGVQAQYYSWRFNSNMFTINTSTYSDPQNEWLFLPPVKDAQDEMLLEVTFKVYGEEYYGNDENITFGYGSEADRDAMTIVKTWEDFPLDVWNTYTVWIAPGTEKFVAGFMTRVHEDGNGICLKDIDIKVSDKPVTVPAAVSDLVVESAPQGENKAIVRFNMPEYSANSQPLSADGLTATISSGVASVTLTGMPGELMQAEVATLDGWDTITVVVSNADEGLPETVKIYTGADIPKALDSIRVSHSQDYKSIHLEWDPVCEGQNGGYVNPEGVTYTLYEFDYYYYEWAKVQDLGNATQCDYIPAVTESIESYELAIGTSNAVGINNTVLTVTAVCGKPYALPMTNDFENYDYLEPMVSEFLDESYTSSFGFVWAAYPYWVPVPTPYGDAAFCATGSDGAKALIDMPAFSTMGAESAALEIPLFGGPASANYKIFAEAYGIPAEVIGTYSEKNEEAFARLRFQLPDKFMGQQWVTVKVQGEFEGTEETTAAFGEYKIQTFYDKDYALTKFTVPLFQYTAQPAKIIAVIENNGNLAAVAPQLEITVTDLNDQLIATVPMERIAGEDNLEVLDNATYSAECSFDGEVSGDIIFIAAIKDSDMDSSNNTQIGLASVGRGHQPVVTDLSTSVNDGEVNLAWTDPLVETGNESFESFVPFSYGDMIGDFKTVLRDEYMPIYFIIPIPYAEDQKAWQVLSQSAIDQLCEEMDIENQWFFSYSGDQMIMAVAPFTHIYGESLIADRWLISPQLVPGSTFKFMLTAGQSGVETLKMYYSCTDDDPDSFELIETVRLLSQGWRQMEYKLPENAKYFAIQYATDCSEGAFSLIDDIEYEPAEESPVLEGFDIMRDGTLIAECAKVSGCYADSPNWSMENIAYNIVPVVSKSGVVERGILSNTAVASNSDKIDSIVAAEGQIIGLEGYILAKGLSGSTLTIYGVDGVEVKSVTCSSDKELIAVASGLYLVQAGSCKAKVFVR